MPHRVAYLGFTDVERKALSTCLDLAPEREPAYMHVSTLSDADLLVADADHAPSVQLVEATDRMAQTVFVGAQAPAGSVAWAPRPVVDAQQVLRELDRLVGHQGAAAPALTLRDLSLPTDPLAASSEPGAPRIFPGAEGLVGHEQPNPGPVAPWTEDLAALQALPVPSLIVAAVVPPASEARPATAQAPAPPPAIPPDLRPAKAARQPKASLLPSQPRALLVDDSVIAMLFLAKRLEAWLLTLDQATSSQAALARLAQQNYDLVFLDVELGADSELDGLALCRQIKQTPETMNTLVVMVSAHHGEIDRVRGALAGCDAYLGKPLDEAELRRLLQRQGVQTRAPAVGAPPG